VSVARRAANLLVVAAGVLLLRLLPRYLVVENFAAR